jgi:shikimate kinase
LTTDRLPSDKKFATVTNEKNDVLTMMAAGQLVWLSATVMAVATHAFTHQPMYSRRESLLTAGGFEWESPEEAFDQGVENPFKNPELMNGGEEGLKIDPARLLGPRLQGSNLYFIGMMGSGKTAVGDIVARRK